MKVELLQAHHALPAAAALEVAALVKLNAEMTTGNARPGALHVGFCLDESGSMADASGISGLSKMDALKAAVQGALELLDGWHATVTISAFADSETSICRRHAMGSGLQQLVASVEKLRAGSGTSAKSAMGPVLQALAPHDHAARRLIIVTDGEFNQDSIKPCVKLAKQAGEDGIAIWAFATGVTYNEAYLRELVGHGAPGGMFGHIQDLSSLRSTFEQELSAIALASESNIEVRLAAGPGCELVDVMRLSPVQTPLLTTPVLRTHDHLDVLDARGQAYVVRVRASGLPAGKQRILDVNVQWTASNQRHAHEDTVMLDVLPAGAAVPAANAQVVTTVLSARAAHATVLGNAQLATQLYAAAGQTQLAGKLSALGTALPTGSDAARALRTEVLGSTKLVALGTAKVTP